MIFQISIWEFLASQLKGQEELILISFFQILIDVKVDEFCYPAFPYVAGFSAIIHDPKTQPLLKFQRQIDLSPGFASNIDITEKRKTMTTESYGYCSSWYNYTLYNPGPNYKGLCAKECLTLEIWHNCGCIPYYSPPLAYYKLMAAPFHMKNVTNSDKYSSGWNRYHRFQFCNVRDGDCVQPIEKMGLGVNGVCVQRCPTPCQESKFVFTMSQSRFPTPNLMNRIKKQLNNSYSLEKARLNLVLANFYFSSTVKKVEQIDIAMTWVDLLGQLGGALGLTIGVSLLSLGEIISWAIWQLVATLTALSKIVCRKNIKWRKPYHL